MRKRLKASLFLLLIALPAAVYALEPYKPDFIVRYTLIDPSKIDVEYAFLEGFETPALTDRSFCYVDFGTAEEYRWYRNESRNENPPSFIAAPWPERPGEYFVKPRDPQRLEIQYERLRFAKNESYYGVLLDVVGDVYRFRNGSELVIEALYNVTAYAHKLGLKVVINLGGAFELIEKASFVDGFMQEDVYFFNGSPAPWDPDYVLQRLYKAKSMGKLVFVIEYVTSEKDFRFVRKALSDFMLFVTDEPYTYSHMPKRYEEAKIEARIKSVR